MRLSVDTVGRNVVLSLPPRASLAKGLAWANTHREWIEKVLARLPPARPLAAGGSMPWEGVERRIAWSNSAPRSPRLTDNCIEVGGPADAVASRLVAWARREARRVLETETRALAGIYDITVGSVGIGDARTRWGSCSATGDIRYSWRLMMAPPFVRKATIAHELAHRVHMNHSPAFHSLAARLTGFDPERSRAWLRANSAALHAVGR